MRINSPIASTLASHSSRSLELGPDLIWPASASLDAACFAGATDTLISMANSYPVAGFRAVWRKPPIESNCGGRLPNPCTHRTRACARMSLLFALGVF
jgi:hypothetical protein